jgi:hypothetical protein
MDECPQREMFRWDIQGVGEDVATNESIKLGADLPETT